MSESGIAAGVRRIEAVAGPGVFDLLTDRERIVKALASSLKVQPDKIMERIATMSDEQRKLAAEVERLKVCDSTCLRCCSFQALTRPARL